MKFEKFKTKDFVTLGIIVIIYTVISFILNALFKFIPFGAFVPYLSTAIFSLLFGGIILVFLINKIPKLGILTLISIIYMLINMALGGGYLPWFITITIGSVLADVIAGSSAYKNKFKNALAYAFMQTGNMAGAIIPVWFFVDQYVQTWREVGLSEESLITMVDAAAGYYGIILFISTFISAFLGIYLGYAVLAKHFKKQEK